ncbi:helix-turn-helix domain-containing protein [Microcoleus sp. D2_18a_D3]|uniref:helix-turn-helix domain-containing protein n=1 Tax=Microcoleus sp. D2_18a_D3 TaxID=3055330 RepID=UPI002FD7913D
MTSIPRFPEEIYLAIAQKLKSRRESMKLSQSEIAQLIRRDRTAVTRIESGNKRLEDAVDLFLISQKLQIPMDSFFPEQLRYLATKPIKEQLLVNLLPNEIQDKITIYQEKVGSISSSQFYALLEIFKENPWGKLRQILAEILKLLCSTWVADKLIEEMQNILLPERGTKTLRFHTRLLAAEVLSASLLSADGLLLPKGKEIAIKIESQLQNIQPDDYNFFFWLKALSNIGQRNSSSEKMTEAFPIMRHKAEQNLSVCQLIFAYHWGEFQKKDGMLLMPFERYLNFLISKRVTNIFDHCLKLWTLAIKSHHCEHKMNLLEILTKSDTYLDLVNEEKVLLIANAICASIHEFNFCHKTDPLTGESEVKQREQIEYLYQKIHPLLHESNSTLVKIFTWKTLLFLNTKKRIQAPYAIGLETEILCEQLFESLISIFQDTLTNPIEKSLIFDSILSSRVERYIVVILEAVYKILTVDSQESQDKLLQSLLIDVLGRTNCRDFLNLHEVSQTDANFFNFCCDPFGYICCNYPLGNFEAKEEDGFMCVEDSWVCSAILRRESSILAHRYFLPKKGTIPCQSISYNYRIGDAIGGLGVRFNLPSNYVYQGKKNPWWIWKIVDEDGDIYTLYSCQLNSLIISRFVNEYFPLDSGWVFFKRDRFVDGFYLYNPDDTPFWGGAWKIEDSSESIAT